MNRGTVAGVAADVRFGSLADIAAAFSNVRFAPESRHHRTSLACPLSANNGHRTRLFDHLIGQRKHVRETLSDKRLQQPIECRAAQRHLSLDIEHTHASRLVSLVSAMLHDLARSSA